MPDLRKEREELAKADHDIAVGEKRIAEQISLIQRMRDGGHDTAQAEILLGNLQHSLEQWHQHRRQILEAIAREERAPSVSKPA